MSQKRDNLAQDKPVDQAKEASPRSGVVPPPEHRWKKGQSGHPQGRPTAGASVQEWLNIMAEWPLADVEKVLSDPSAPMAKRSAARVWKFSQSQDLASSGMPIAGPDFDRIMDRTEGKPKQSVDVKMDASLEHKNATQEAMKKILGDPETFAAAEVLAAKLDVSEPENT